jgi:heptosyltransferase II
MPPARRGRRSTPTAVRALEPTVVRAPNHLGDLVMSLPALEAAGPADILVAAPIAPLLAMARIDGRVIPLVRGTRGAARAVRALRHGHYTRGVLLTPSFSSALLFRLGGIPTRRGTPTDARATLLTDPVPPAALTGLHRAVQYFFLLTGNHSTDLVPRLQVPPTAQTQFDELLTASGDGPLIGLFPGSHAASRRWSAQSFAELAARLANRGYRVAVFGGPRERPITSQVAGRAAADLGGRTDLQTLAAGLAACALVVTNDSGPLHVAAAVGTPTISLWGAGDPRITGPLGASNRLLRHPELPCVPCTRNVCPRAGAGYVLPDAHNECLALITVDDVDTAVSTYFTQP